MRDACSADQRRQVVRDQRIVLHHQDPLWPNRGLLLRVVRLSFRNGACALVHAATIGRKRQIHLEPSGKELPIELSAQAFGNGAHQRIASACQSRRARRSVRRVSHSLLSPQDVKRAVRQGPPN